MPAPRGQGGASIKISAATHARVVLACEQIRPRISVSEWMERAALASLKRQEDAGRIKAYERDEAAAREARKAPPNPEDYGLPRDYGIPLHP